MKKIIIYLIFFGFISLKAQVFNGVGGPIPDIINSDFTLNISTISPSSLTSGHGLVRVCLDVNHTYISDLNVSLMSPSGNRIILIGHVGGGGQNFTNTCLIDTSSNPIAFGTPPFTGVFKPSEDLGNLNDSAAANGIWTLSISDDAVADTGFLNSWSLEFDTGATAPFILSSSNLPIVIINTLGQTIIDEPKINCQMKIINNAAGIRNYVTDLPQYEAGIGIEIRGNYSSILPQKPYAFSTQDIAFMDSNVSLVGLPSEHDWILQSTYNDKTFMRNQMMFDLARKMGTYAPRTINCEVIINNQYKGIYFICEKIKRDNNRVNIARLDSNDNAGDSLTGGYIFKHDYDDIGWDSYWTDSACSTRTLHYNYYYPSAANISLQQEEYIKNYVDSFEVTLFSNHFQDSTWGYHRFISQKTFVDYLILNDLSGNGDGYKKSMFFNKDKNEKIKAGPIWDFDWALKFEPSLDSTLGSWFYARNPCDGDILFTPWFNRLMQDTTFENAVYCRWQELRSSLLIDTSSLFHTIDSFHFAMEESQVRHFNKWRILGLDSGSPEVYPIPISYSEELDRLKFFIEKRIAWIDSNIHGHCYIQVVDTSNLDTTNTDTLGVYDVYELENTIRIFPNPTKDFLQIISKGGNSIKSICINNLLGKLIYTEELIGNKYSYNMNVSELEIGNYIITICDDKGRIARFKLFKIN